MLATVKGGTGAGRKMHLATVPSQPWTCSCGHVNKGVYANCMAAGCLEKRPK